MSDDAPPALTRKQQTAVRRIERWAALPTSAGLSSIDSLAYRALVDTLVGAMTAVGHVDAMEGIAALTKTLALMLAATLQFENDAKVSEICTGQAAWIENEVMALRQSIRAAGKMEQ